MLAISFGTCRVYGATALIRGVRRFPHRIHNMSEIERAVQTYKNNKFDENFIHLFSQHAIDILISEKEKCIENLENEIKIIQRDNDLYIIEISSNREYKSIINGVNILVDTVSKNTILSGKDNLDEFYRDGMISKISEISCTKLNEAQIFASMKRIRDFLSRPIIWVGHCSLHDPLPEEEHVASLRRTLNAQVERSSMKLGDRFIDPTPLVSSVGRSAFFEKDGRDLFHYTGAGHAALAAKVKEAMSEISCLR